MVFTKDKVYKDLNVYKVKSDDTAELRNQTVLGDPAGSASGPEVEASGGAIDETTESAIDVDEEGESLARGRIRRRIVPPARYFDSEDIAAFALSVADDLCAEEPQDNHGAMNSKEKRQWNGACGEEMTSLDKNQTLKLVRRPSKHKVIGCKWVFKLKSGVPGVEKPRFKARLVAKGYSQK